MEKEKKQKEKKIREFDVNQANLPRKKKESVEKVYQDFSTHLESILSTTLPLACKVDFQKIDFYSYGKYKETMTGAVLLSSFDIDPNSTLGLLRIDGDLALVAIDCVLGGKGELPSVKRDLSVIELKMSEDLVGKILNGLNSVWETFGECTFQFNSNAQNPEKAKFVKPEEPVIVASFLVELGPAKGIIEACFTFDFLKPFLSSMAKPDADGFGDLTDPKIIRVVKEKISNINIPLGVYLGEVCLPLEDLTELEKGDVLKLKKVNKELVIKAENIPVFLGRPGIYNEKVAVEVLKSSQASVDDQDACS